MKPPLRLRTMHLSQTSTLWFLVIKWLMNPKSSLFHNTFYLFMPRQRESSLPNSLSVTCQHKICKFPGYEDLSDNGGQFIFSPPAHLYSQTNSTFHKARSRAKFPSMSDVQAIDGTPLRFLYMCMHDVTGSFRRRDGHPLNFSTLTSPFDPEVALEPLDVQAHPQVEPEIRPQLRLCPGCLQRRTARMERLRWRGRRGSIGMVSRRALVRIAEAKAANEAEDVRLMERALGKDIRQVRHRLEARLTETAENIGNNPWQLPQ